jgi:hypothetical protein
MASESSTTLGQDPVSYLFAFDSTPTLKYGGNLIDRGHAAATVRG